MLMTCFIYNHTHTDRGWERNTQKQTKRDSSSLICSMAVRLIGWFARNAANVNRQSSVKTTLSLSACVCVFVFLSEFVRTGGRATEILFLYVFVSLQFCVCLQRNRVCMFDGEGSTLHDKYTLSNTVCVCARLGWTEQRHTCLCIGMASLSWLQTIRCGFFFIFWGLRIAPSSFVDFKITRFWNLILAVIGAHVEWC